MVTLGEGPARGLDHMAFKGAHQEDGKGRAKGQMLKGGSLQWTAVGSVQRVQGS